MVCQFLPSTGRGDFGNLPCRHIIIGARRFKSRPYFNMADGLAALGNMVHRVCARRHPVTHVILGKKQIDGLQNLRCRAP